MSSLRNCLSSANALSACPRSCYANALFTPKHSKIVIITKVDFLLEKTQFWKMQQYLGLNFPLLLVLSDSPFFGIKDIQ